MTPAELWAAKSDEELIQAASSLNDFTATAQAIILAEVSSRGLTIPTGEEAQQAATAGFQGQPFFAVSCLKFAVMSICTFSLYTIYWFYKQWQKVNNQILKSPDSFPEEKTVWPVVRALFSFLFCYSLADRVRAISDRLQLPPQFVPGRAALGYGTLVILSRLTRLHPLLGLLVFITFVPLLEIQRQVNRINEVVAPEAPANSRFSKWNVVAVISGGLLLIATAISPLIPTPQPIDQTSGPSPTEIKLSKLIHLSTLLATEDRTKPLPDLKFVANAVSFAAEETHSYSASRVIRDLTNEQITLGDHILAQWRLDYVRPDQYHVSQAASNGDFDEWITVGAAHYQNVGLWMQIDGGNWSRAESSLRVDNFASLLRLATPVSGAVYMYEDHRYLRLDYTALGLTSSINHNWQDLFGDCLSLRNNICELHMWLDLDSNLIAKGEIVVRGEDGKGNRTDMEIQQAFTAYDAPIIVRPPTKLNATPNAHGSQTITSAEVEVVPFYR